MSDTEQQLHIRDAADRDTDAIRALLVESYSQYEQTLPSERWADYRRDIEASVTREGPIGRIIAEYEGEIVGSILLFDSSESAYGLPQLEIRTPIIRLLSVSPKARGKGVATALIKESARRSRELGAPTLHLHTSDMMASAIRLYERLGFERAHDKDLKNGETVVKSYVLHLHETALL